MKIERKHPEYMRLRPQWELMRDSHAGQRAIQEKGEIYLPRPPSFRPEDYEFYKRMARYFAAVAKTVAVWAGLVTRKATTIAFKGSDNQSQEEPAKTLAEVTEDATETGCSLEALGDLVFQEIAVVGRYGLLMDFNRKTKRPYFSGYEAERIWDWQSSVIGGKSVITYLTLSELSTDIFLPDGSDAAKFETIESDASEHKKVVFTQVRVLSIEGDLDKELLIVRIFRKPRKDVKVPGMEASEDDWILVDESKPDRKTKPLTSMPFIFVNAEDTKPEACNPPLMDLAEAAIDWYNVNAQFKHGLYWTANPIPVVTGVPNTVKLTVGGQSVWAFESKDAKAYLLEYSGAGLSTYRTELDSIQNQMAVLGVRSLMTEGSTGEETATGVTVRAVGDTASLARVVSVISEAMTMGLQWSAWWVSGKDDPKDHDDISVDLNKDFVSLKIDPARIQALVGAWMSDAISHETFLYNMEQGEILEPGVTAEREMERIEIQNLPAIAETETETETGTQNQT